MELLRSVKEARAFAAGTHGARQRLGLVPTMGYLHVGHLALMETAAKHADIVMTSIFVNPTQFGPGEDLDRYPRDPEGDLAKAEAAGCHAVFMPPVEAMYPGGASSATRVHCEALSGVLCGASRPGHFSGVCTIVLKLFNITRCDVAVFGEKDYQQLAIIRRMVADLDVPVDIVGHPIVREPDGLAMSSRNAYLTPAERLAARCLSRALREAQAAWASAYQPAEIVSLVRDRIQAEPLARIDYVEARDAGDLGLPGDRDVLLALAVHFGQTRLIDNTVLRRPRSSQPPPG